MKTRKLDSNGKVVWSRGKYKKGGWGRAREKAKSSNLLRKTLLSALLRSIRTQLKITQKELGKYLGVSSLTVSRWERKDGTWPRSYRWRRIREVWGITREMKKESFWLDRTTPPDFSR